jgi:CheY-like chemotaxis protein
MMEANDARRTVLIVDDTPDNISILNAALMEEYTIKVATRGKKAIEIAMTTPVDIILLDVMMPEMDGFETCRRLKEEPETRRIRSSSSQRGARLKTSRWDFPAAASTTSPSRSALPSCRHG